MNDKFFELKKEKQDRMINAALKIFGLSGYRFASTDDIVKEAGISKGLLFHYFTSKIGLYTFVYDYAVRYMSMELCNAINPKETDFFAIYKQMEIAKLQVLKNYPYLQLFLERCNTENVSEALLAIEEQRNKLTDLYDRIDAQADMSGFRSEAEGRRVQKILKYTLSGLLAEHIYEHSLNAEMLYEENIAYLTLLLSLAK